MIFGVEIDCYCLVSFMFYVCNVFFDAFTRAPLRFTGEKDGQQNVQKWTYQ